MSAFEICFGGAGILAVLLTLVQISPIKVNPWNKIARAIGKSLTVDVLEKMEEDKADNARYRILRFDDEIRHKVLHTEEHFNQIISDVDAYKRYCDTHPNYKNSKAISAIENIRETWKRCRSENTFLV